MAPNTEVHLMSRLIISGPYKFSDEVSVQGAKNSILPILASSIISRSECIIKNCPNILDVHTTIEILRYIGCKVKFEDSTICVNSENILKNEIPEKLMRKMRSSITFLGALIARTGRAKISLPGGCELGPRPIDMHISSLKQLGISVEVINGSLDFKVINKVSEANISLPFPSVGATENIILVSSICKGTVTINNASCEPEIVDLVNFLKKIGIKIYGEGGNQIKIQGTDKFSGCEHEVIPDRIVATTLLGATATTGGTITLKNINCEHLNVPISVFEEMGCLINKREKTLKMNAPEKLLPVKEIRSMPYPGFPTDAIPIMTACLCTANGVSILVENIFKNRFRHVEELCRFGANIKVEGNIAIINGVSHLFSSNVEAKDLRGAAALLIAALKSHGTSTISNVELFLRGYDISKLIPKTIYKLEL